MRTRLTVLVLVAVCITVSYSLLQGQERGATTPPAPTAAPAPTATPTPTAPLAPPRDLSQLSKLQQQMLYTAQRGADWLFRMHGVKGRFVAGYNPSLKQPLESDNYLHQAGAAGALAKAARFIGEERYAARATQALLALLEDTAPDPEDSHSRRTTLPPLVVNRLGAAAQLVLAIHELPAPQKDLLDRAEELTRSIGRSVATDGSLRYQAEENARPDEGMNHYPGLALAALARSHRVRPAAWKLDTVRRALPVYRAWWKQQRSTDFVPRQSEAWAEAYFASRDRTLADFVFEMNDWVCTLQYTQIDPRRMYWYGGFRAWREGRPVESEPQVQGAALAHSLVQAARVAREVGDVERFARYNEAIERSLQFLATLQYSDAGTQHFAAWYRPQLVGGFHASHQDGNLRIDYNQHAVTTLLGYLEHVAVNTPVEK